MPALSFSDARSLVIREVRAGAIAREPETVSLIESAGRVLAEDIVSDRDYPPFHRSARDGFAIRAADVPGEVRLIGEVRAGEVFAGRPEAGEAVEIMTGAPVPEGADAVVMVEHCERRAGGAVFTNRTSAPGENIAPRGCEAARGSVVLPRGTRIDHTGVNWLAATGHSRVRVFTRPEVAILATGDELVDIEREPAPQQIRNSNAWSLAAQVLRAGAMPVVLPIAPDVQGPTRALIERALRPIFCCCREAFRRAVTTWSSRRWPNSARSSSSTACVIQPGQPLVFGRARGKFFFGLPGNPAFDHGHVRALRAGCNRPAFGSGGNAPAVDARPPDGAFSA